jgi:hypothetical protein
VWLNLTVLAFLVVGPDPAQARSGGLDTSDLGECAAGAGSRTLKLDVAVDPTIVVPTPSQDRQPAAPHTSKVRLILTNPGPRELRLTFPDSCFLAYEVRTADGADLLPQEDAGLCYTALWEITLAPGASESKEYRWTARSWDAGGVFTPMRPGRYKIVGTLKKRYCSAPGGGTQEEPPLETAPVTVEVRPAAN